MGLLSCEAAYIPGLVSHGLPLFCKVTLLTWEYYNSQMSQDLLGFRTMALVSEGHGPGAGTRNLVPEEFPKHMRRGFCRNRSFYLLQMGLLC